MSNFFSRFTRTGESVRGFRNPRHKSRKLHYEPLEERQLLAVTSAEFDAIRAQYADLNLAENMEAYNIIEISSDELSSLSLRDAIAQAGTTTENDLIVVRTTTENNTVTLSGEQLEININAEEFGSVAIVSLGETKLTIDANKESRVLDITEGADVALAGLTITNGQTPDYESGGGIFNVNSTVTITNSTITGNSASSYGGGVFNRGGTVTIISSTISDNTAQIGGGGIFSSLDTYYLDDDGEIVIVGGALTITNCTISGNTADHGGGIYNSSSITMALTNSEISGNTAVYLGGGIFNSYATFYFVSGGAIDIVGAVSTITNCTISGNAAETGEGSGIYINDALEIYNSIVLENSGSDIQHHEYHLGIITGSNNLTTFEDWNEDSGENFLYDTELPLFVDVYNGDYRLAEGSQAIDQGCNDYVTTEFDLDGNPRIRNGNVDIGAYEYFELSPAELVVSYITMPQEAVAGTSIDVSWIIANIGELPAIEPRTVEVYLSWSELTPGWIRLGTFEYSDVIDPDTSFTQTEQVTIPRYITGQIQIVVVVVGENTDLARSAETINIVTPSLEIAVDKDSLKEGIEDGVEFTITRTGDLSEDLILTITTSDDTVLDVPMTVTIPAGDNSVKFYGSSILHENGSGNRQATVTVAAENFADVMTTITVLDILPAELVVELLAMPEQVVAGSQIDVSWIIRNIGDLPFEDNIMELLYITDTGNVADCVSLGNFSQIRMIEGFSQLERTITFSVPLDYSGEYKIVLSIPGHTSFLVSNVFTVVAPEISVTSNVSEIKEGAEDGVTFTVTRTGDFSKDLLLTVTSSNTSKLIVPEFVIIPAGTSSVTFNGMSLRTNVREDDIPVTVTFAAADFEIKSLEILVLDDTRIELVNTEFSAPMAFRYDSAFPFINVSWFVTSSATFVLEPNEWVDKIYLSPDGSMENAILVGALPGGYGVGDRMDAGKAYLCEQSITIPEGSSGDYVLIVETMFGKTQSELVFADIHLISGTDPYTFRLSMPDQENVHWTIRPDVWGYYVHGTEFKKEGVWVCVFNERGQTVFEDKLEYFDGIEITGAASHDSILTVDFITCDMGMNRSVAFIGNPEQRNTLMLLGSKYSNDDFYFNFNDSRGTFNELQLAWNNVNYISIDCKTSWEYMTGETDFDTATIISDESASARFTVSDNLFVMDNGKLRMEIANIDSIDAFGAGRHNSAYIYGENDSLIIMNDLFTERRNEAGIYRIWHCEQVTAVNADDTNNAVLHFGSRGHNVYMIAEGYGFATNAVGSYYHEFIGFENVIVSTPLSVPVISLPETENWRQESDRGIWTQNDFTLTVMGNANIVKREGPELDLPDPVEEEPEPEGAVSSLSQATDNFWDDNLYHFLAEEHISLQRKKDKWFGQDDEADDWLEEFEEFALLELRK